MKKLTNYLLFGVFLLLSHGVFSQAQPMQTWHGGEIKNALKKSQVLGSVLYMAAHPDDENTRFIAYSAKGLGMRTAYLSLTRGDGGQNLVGKEVRELLGVIRTQELLAARRTDGGEQFFSRANDFGYSKHPDETLEIWEQDEVLSDAVWVIRKFRPDIIVTRFSPDRAGRTHGHHTTSALLAVKAAKAAADPKQFPEQLKHVQVWSPKRVVWNTSWWFFRGKEESFDASKYMQVDIGEYSPLLGASYNEIASKSRSMHKSQGFGSAISRGSTIEYFQHLYGDSATDNTLFQGIAVDWSRVKGGEKIGALLAKADREFKMEQPAAILPHLTQALKKLQQLDASDYWVKQKKKEIEMLILQCAGVWAAATAADYYASAGDSLELTLSFLRREKAPVRLQKVMLEMNGTQQEVKMDSAMAFNKLYETKLPIQLPANMPISQHYWLKEKASKGMFRVDELQLRGLPENPCTLPVKATFLIGEEELPIVVNMPTLYRWTDPVAGERHRPLEVTPIVTSNIDQDNYIFASADPKPVQVRVKAFRANLEGKLSLLLPKGWRSEPTSMEVSLQKKGEEKLVTFQVFPPEGASVGKIGAQVKVDGKMYRHSLVSINYPHIPIQTLFPHSEAKLVRLNIKKQGDKVGYIMGAGDAIPEALRQIGYQVDLLEDANITVENLAQYDAVIAGVRAYNTNERMGFHHPILMEYVKNGGSYIVQYNTSFRLKSDEVGPYPLELSRDRVTVEEAAIQILAPEHPIMQVPNKITAADFDGWVQERGLYFPNKWDDKYTPLLSCHDPGEESLTGGLLATTYGKGTFIYTGYSWFRELPAGVPGAYRLFVNLISYKQ